jgi:hypothetical protein
MVASSFWPARKGFRSGSIAATWRPAVSSRGGKSVPPIRLASTLLVVVLECFSRATTRGTSIVTTVSPTNSTSRGAYADGARIADGTGIYRRRVRVVTRRPPTGVCEYPQRTRRHLHEADSSCSRGGSADCTERGAWQVPHRLVRDGRYLVYSQLGSTTNGTSGFCRFKAAIARRVRTCRLPLRKRAASCRLMGDGWATWPATLRDGTSTCSPFRRRGTRRAWRRHIPETGRFGTGLAR